jgi:hypothetical protein
MFFKQNDANKVIQTSIIKMLIKSHEHGLRLISTLNLNQNKIK